MTVAQFETLETHSRSRPWRCTVAVPYSHKAHAPAIDRHITHADDKVARDRGLFFMGTLHSLQAAARLLCWRVTANALHASDPPAAPQETWMPLRTWTSAGR